MGKKIPSRLPSLFIKDLRPQKLDFGRRHHAMQILIKESFNEEKESVKGIIQFIVGNFLNDFAEEKNEKHEKNFVSRKKD